MGVPFRADWKAMPPPMMPAPSTAALLISRLALAVLPFTFLTCWSARNRPTMAVACGVLATLAKPLDSTSSASLRFMPAAFCMDFTASMGAG